jgi:hypothetical protein
VNGLEFGFGCSAGADIYNDRSGREGSCSGMAGKQKIFTRGITDSGEE